MSLPAHEGRGPLEGGGTGETAPHTQAVHDRRRPWRGPTYRYLAPFVRREVKRPHIIEESTAFALSQRNKEAVTTALLVHTRQKAKAGSWLQRNGELGPAPCGHVKHPGVVQQPRGTRSCALPTQTPITDRTRVGARVCRLVFAQTHHRTR